MSERPPSERPDATPITEAHVLKALSHPLRARLYYALFARGTARAADLAAELEAPANLVSQHLRLLAKYGLIEEAPEQARDKRERVWRPASTKGVAPDPALQATPAYREAGRQAGHKVLDAYLTRARPGFHHANDVTVYLSEEEVERFAAELEDLLLRWNKHGQDSNLAQPDVERSTYLTNVYIQPLPPD